MVTGGADFIVPHIIENLHNEGNEFIFQDEFDDYYNPQIKRKNVEPFQKHPNQPVSPNGVSKLMAEHYCRVLEELYDLKSVSLRYFTVYDPRMRPDLAISIFTKAALKNKTITIFGDGQKTRDFTCIDDIVRANLIGMKKGSGVYNIGSGHSISINELASKIIETNESKSEIVYTDSVKGDAEHTLSNYEKAWHEIGWKPEVTIEDELERYAKWILNSQL